MPVDPTTQRRVMFKLITSPPQFPPPDIETNADHSMQYAGDPADSVSVPVPEIVPVMSTRISVASTILAQQQSVGGV